MGGSALGGMARPAISGLMPQGGQRIGNQIVPSGYELNDQSQIVAQSPKQGSAMPEMPKQPNLLSLSGKGQYAPLSAQGNFNVNQAAAGGLQQAMQGTQAGMGFQAQGVRPTSYSAARAGSQGYNAATIGSTPTVGAQNIRAGQLAGRNLSAYTNPYESQVVDQSLADLERTRLMQQNQLGAQASAAGAFGGSRQGIAEAETNRAFADQAARTASGLRQAGFQNAQQMAGQDIATQMQAALANQQAGLQAGTTTANLQQQAAIASQAAQNQARQFGAGAANVASLQNMAAQNQARQFGAQQAMTAQQLNQMAGLQANQQRLGAASQMGQLGQQAFSTGQAISQQQMQQGLMQQGLQQALIDAARGQYAGYAGAPQAALAAPLAALGVTPTPQTTTQSKQPGIFDYLSLGLMASDIRLKKDIKLLGKERGHNVYSWEWTDEGKRIADPSQPKVGVMAQELQETHPHLVKLGADGFLRVDYSGLAAEAA